MSAAGLLGRLHRPRPGLVDRSAVARVRAYDFTDRSDAELKESLFRKNRSPLTVPEIEEVCAVLAEAVDRRMGAWRLFDGGLEKGRLRRCEELAGRLLVDAPHRARLAYYTDPDFLEGEAFASSLEPSFREWRLCEAERTVIRTTVYVAEKAGVPSSHLLLPAGFYRALREIDGDGVLAFRVTDEQIMAGIALYGGSIVEMDAGEGKTVAAAIPAVLHAIEDRRVHVITANDYLAQRDAETLAPVYESLGLTVGAVLSTMTDDERRHAYGRQIVYGTLREFAFDFLRDSLRAPRDDRVQRSLQVAVVDEADHALIDQARTPLIISGEPVGGRRAFARTRRVIEDLVSRQGEVIEELEDLVARGGDAVPQPVLVRLSLADPDNEVLRGYLTEHPRIGRRVGRLVDSLDLACDDHLVGGLPFVVDRNGNSVALTDEGQWFVEVRLGPIFDTSELERLLDEAQEGGTASEDTAQRLRRSIDRRHSRMNQVHQMLRAHVLLERDVDYVVTDGRVVLVDALTGRRLTDNRYQYDLHAALEAKEGVEVLAAPETLARISVPGFVRQYSILSGLTGTAMDSAGEFGREYGKSVVRVPSTQPSRRVALPSRLYRTAAGKLAGLLGEVRLCRRVGRPVLVGTVTVEQSERLCRLLAEHGVEHRLLNAVNCASEAEIVKSAGAHGAVTIATNMAGRGTDILVEPGLDARIIAGYLSLAHDLLADGAAEVRLECGSTTEADALLAGVRSDVGGLGESYSSRDRTVGLKKPSGNGAGSVVTLEFGLGLYVIATEMNRSHRADRQLRGRTARQGAFGSSRVMLSTEDVQRSFPGGSGADFARRTVVQGPGTERMLLRSQRLTEDEDEAHRGYVSEYGSILDAQTVAYYRARREVAHSVSFHGLCEDLVRECAGRLVQRHFPGLRVTGYADRFDRLVREVENDFGVDCAGLFGSALPSLADEIGALMLAKLDTLRDALGDKRLAEIERSLFIQTADEEWKGHLADLEGLVMGIPAELDGRAAAMSRFAVRAFEAYGQFKDRAIYAFIAELLTLPVDDLPLQQSSLVEIMEEAASILAPEAVTSDVDD